MPSSLTPILHLVLQDLDECNEALRAWDLELMQLDRGPFRGELIQARAGSTLCSFAHFGRALQQLGSSPTGLRTLAILAKRDDHLIWRGQHATGRDVFVFPPDGELECVSRASFHVYTVSGPESEIVAIAENSGLQAGLHHLVRGGVVRCHPERIAAIRDHLHDLESRWSDPVPSGIGRETGFTALWRLFLLALSESLGDQAARLSIQRMAISRAASDLLARHTALPPRIPEVAEALGTSTRTLRRAFLEQYGVGPKAYLQTLRFHAVRRALREAGPRRTTVSDIAYAHGFSHMGQFAVDYRRMFGESPSDTLLTKRPRHVS